MKKITYLFIALIIMPFVANSQEINIPNSVSINEAAMPLDNIERNGFAMGVDGKSKDILKAFEDYLTETYKLELKTKSNQITGTALQNASISDKGFNLYSYINETAGGNELRLFLSLGIDIYVNSKDYPNESTRAKLILKDFIKSYYSNVVNASIAEKNDDLADDIKDLGKIKANIAGYAKDKAKTEQSISKADKKIKKYEEKIADLQKDIAEEQNEVKELGTEVTKIAKETSELETKQKELDTKVAVQNKEIAELTAKLKAIAGY